MAITVVQSKTASATSGTSLTATLTATTAGNLLIAVAWGNVNGNLSYTWTPPAGWTTPTGSSFSEAEWDTECGGIFYYANCPAGVTTVAFSESAGNLFGATLLVLEVSGCDTTAPFDVLSVVTPTATKTTTPSVTATTTAAGDFLLGLNLQDAGTNGADATVTQPSGWTATASVVDGVNVSSIHGGYEVQASAGSVTYQVTQSNNNFAVMALIAFKAASGGGVTVNGIGESDGIGTATASATLSVSALSDGTGAAETASASLSVAAALSDGAGTATAVAALSVAGADSAGSGAASVASLLGVGLTAGGGVSSGRALDVALLPTAVPPTPHGVSVALASGSGGAATGVAVTAAAGAPAGVSLAVGTAAGTPAGVSVVEG